MQDQYVGDVGDFGKYGLLRHLCGLREGVGGPALLLGVVWYLMPNGRGNDGKHLSYLAPPLNNPNRECFTKCDDQLYDALDDIVYHGSYPEIHRERRTVRAVQDSNILPGAVFYDDPLVVDGRLVDRQAWAKAAVERTNDCDVIFVDPDNGLEPPSGPSPKHVAFGELVEYIREGKGRQAKSLVVYHHLGHSASADEQIGSRAIDLGRCFGTSHVIGLRYRRGSPRAFFIVSNGREDLFNHRIEAFLNSPWGQEKLRGRPHFQLVPEAQL
jgi:hypothetical protein